MRNPIHDTAWESLKNLSADLVRFVPWYPYPRRSVAELLPPVSGKPTSWNFTLLIPQLEDFFRATADQGHETIVNFATQPVRPSSILAAASQSHAPGHVQCWLFNKNLTTCTPPPNPDEADFNCMRRNSLCVFGSLKELLHRRRWRRLLLRARPNGPAASRLLQPPHWLSAERRDGR